MTVLFVGASHATAPLPLIEHLSFSADDAVATLARVTTGDLEPTLPVRELVLLSTCHRVELYAVPADDATRPSAALDAMAGVLASRSHGMEAFDAHVRRLVGTEATRHLFRVAAGLESMVLGESEVLGQVASALALATNIGAAGPVLTPLFEAAIRTGRRARAETAIGSAPASVSSIAAELAEELAEDLRGRRALFLGGGKIALLAAKALRACGFWEMSIGAPVGVDAHALAQEFGATAIQPDAIPKAIAESDLVFTCAGAPMAVDAITIRHAMRGRMARPLAFIDLSAGDVLDAGVAELAGVRVVFSSELRERIDIVMAGRRRETPLVEAILEQELRALRSRREASSLSSVVAALRARAEEIRQRELSRALASMPDADGVVRTQMEWLSVSLVNKLLDEPTRRLRAEATHGAENPYAEVTRELFGLGVERADRPIA
jgi:glutamyl-tRNA reductase